MSKLRLIVFSHRSWCFELIRNWADASGHSIELLVTVPGPPTNPTSHCDVISRAHPHTRVMVCLNPNEILPLLPQIYPDLAVVCAFKKISQKISEFPRYGAVNIHPSLLPKYRGPNAYRALYEGEREIGATLHRITPDLDCGPILAQSSCTVPESIQIDDVTERWRSCMKGVLNDGVEQLVSGAVGQPQDDSAATYAALFSEHDANLGPGISVRVIQARYSALTLADVTPRIRIESTQYNITDLRIIPGVAPKSPDAIIWTGERHAIVVMTDGVIEVQLQPVDR